jgi:outer membrane immunogenic protein
MNKYTAATCMLLLAVFAALPANADDFKGFYFGGNAGSAHHDINAKTTTVFSPTGYFASSSVPAIATAGNQNVTGFMPTGGGQFGYNFQKGKFVVGFETDFGAMSSVSKSTTATYPCCAPTAFTVKQSVNTNWLFTARPRAGFTLGPVLVYGTGGIAITNAGYEVLFTDSFATAHENALIKPSAKNGWIAGGGAEFRLSHDWSLKTEYLHANFGTAATVTSNNLTAFTPAIAFPTNVFTHQVGDLSTNIVRSGLNFRF